MKVGDVYYRWSDGKLKEYEISEIKEQNLSGPITYKSITFVGGVDSTTDCELNYHYHRTPKEALLSELTSTNRKSVDLYNEINDNVSKRSKLWRMIDECR